MSKNKLFRILGALGLSAILAAGCTSADTSSAASGGNDDSAGQPTEMVTEGATLPAIRFTEEDGSEFVLTELIGKPVVINFFASWCPPCVVELPAFQAVSQEFGDEVSFIGISSVDTPSDTQQLLERTGVTYQTVSDPKGDAMALFGVAALPGTVFVNADGTVAKFHYGQLDAGKLRQIINDNIIS